MTSPVRYDVAEGVATVTLSRPERRNAINAALARAVTEAMSRADADPDVRAVVLTGDDPAFCAGLDLDELGATGENLRPFEAPGSPWSPGGGTWWPMQTPVIGAINGPAVTGGLEMALHCDFLVASDRARFADTHVRVGVFPGGGMLALLPRAIGSRRALEMHLSGNFIDAGQARELGLVNHVVAHDQLMETAYRLARDIVENDPVLVTALLEGARRMMATTLPDAIETEAELSRRWLDGFDHGAVAGRRAGVVERGRAQG